MNFNHLTLFLFKRDFTDGGDQEYFCPSCLRVEGLMAIFPEIRHQVEVRYVDFDKPRSTLVNLLGEENQSCPRLVFQGDCSERNIEGFELVRDNISQLTSTNDIIQYFIKRHDLSHIHP